MKTYLARINTVFAILLAAGLVSLAGCSGEKSKSIVFNAETRYNRAEKLRQKAGIEQAVDANEIFAQLKKAYLETTSYCWKNIDSLPVEKYPDDRKALRNVAFMATNRLIQL